MKKGLVKCTMDKEKLLPCPSCGGKANLKKQIAISQDYCFAEVKCDCGMKVRKCISLDYSATEECIRIWNMRGGNDG